MKPEELVGANLRRLRTARNMTQEQLALDSELSMAYISDIETGKRNITIGTALKIVKVLGSSLAELFAGLED